MLTAAQIAARKAVLAGLKASFNGQIAATDAANKALDAAISTMPDLIPCKQGAIRVVDALNSYAPAIIAAINFANGLTPSDPPPPVEPANGFMVGATVFASLQAAFDAVQPGGVVRAFGEMGGQAAFLRVAGVTLRGPAYLPANNAHAGGKASIVQQAPDFTVEDIDASGMAAPDGNGSFIRCEANNLTMRKCKIHDGQQGLLTNQLPDSKVLLEDCEFYRLGSGSGQTHNIYIGRVAELKIVRGRYDDAIKGHCIKSRAARLIIDGAQIHEGRASRAIDIAEGGEVDIGGCNIVQTQETDNSGVIAYGIEGKPWPVNTFLFRASNKVLDLRNPKGAVFFFKYEPDVKVIEVYSPAEPPVVIPPPPPPPSAEEVTVTPVRDANGKVLDSWWQSLPLNTVVKVAGTRPDLALQPLINAIPGFIDYGVEKGSGIWADWAGAAWDRVRRRLSGVGGGHGGTNNNMLWELIMDELRFGMSIPPTVIDAPMLAYIKSKLGSPTWWPARVDYGYDGQPGSFYPDPANFDLPGDPTALHTFDLFAVDYRRGGRILTARTGAYCAHVPGVGHVRLAGPQDGTYSYGKMILDHETDRLFHTSQGIGLRQYRIVNPETGVILSTNTIVLPAGLSSTHHFQYSGGVVQVGRKIYFFNPYRQASFSLDVDSKAGAKMEVPFPFGIPENGGACVAIGGNKVMMLAPQSLNGVNKELLMLIDVDTQTCTEFAYNGLIPPGQNGDYGRFFFDEKWRVVGMTRRWNQELRLMRIE